MLCRVRRRLHRFLRDLEHLHLLLLAQALQLIASEAAPQLLRPGRIDHLYPRNARPSAALLVEATSEQRKGPRGRTSRR